MGDSDCPPQHLSIIFSFKLLRHFRSRKMRKAAFSEITAKNNTLCRRAKRLFFESSGKVKKKTFFSPPRKYFIQQHKYCQDGGFELRPLIKATKANFLTRDDTPDHQTCCDAFVSIA